MAMPTKDSLLVAWGSNFDVKVTANPATYSLSAGQATSFHTVYAAFVTAYNAVATAKAAGSRSKSVTAAKDAAKAALFGVGRMLYGIVQDSTSVSNANKEDIGVVVKKTHPTPVPPPADAPEIDVVSVNAWTVKIKLHGTIGSPRRGKPAGVSGASVFSFVGATAPVDLTSWQFEGNTGKTAMDVNFANTVAPGAKVWITAFWFNGRKQAGPTCTPLSANLPGGSVSMAA